MKPGTEMERSNLEEVVGKIAMGALVNLWKLKPRKRRNKKKKKVLFVIFGRGREKGKVENANTKRGKREKKK